MGKQEEFVLRALEERDVRFVRLWFTDVLGSLKSVAIAPAELEGAFSEGIGFDGSAIEGFARVYEADMLAKPDPSDLPDPAVARRGPVDRPDVLRHRDAGRPPVVRRPAVRAQAHPVEGGGERLSRLHAPEIEFYLFKDTPQPGADPVPVDWSATDHTAQSSGAGFSPRGDHDAGVDGHLGGVQPPRGRPRPAGDRPALRRRCPPRTTS